MNYYHDIMQLIGTGVDAVGIMIIVIGAVVATVHFVGNRRTDFGSAYRSYRQGLGRAILLGLEFLIAGDIVRTVVVAPTHENVLILALIVIIRTFLSMALQLEVEGRWPWRRGDALKPTAPCRSTHNVYYGKNWVPLKVGATGFPGTPVPRLSPAADASPLRGRPLSPELEPPRTRAPRQL